jgi:hypothetical protein
MAIARSRLTNQRSPWRWTRALLCAVLAVAGCAGQKPSVLHSGHAAQTGHKRASASPSPTTPGKTKKRLAAAYIAIALPANRRLEKANDSYEESERDNFVIAKRDLRDEVATEREFDTQLLRIDFPANVAEIAWDLVQANNHRIALTERQSHSATIAKLRAFDSRHKAADAAVEVQVRIIRQELGLPPPDND